MKNIKDTRITKLIFDDFEHKVHPKFNLFLGNSLVINPVLQKNINSFIQAGNSPNFEIKSEFVNDCEIKVRIYDDKLLSHPAKLTKYIKSLYEDKNQYFIQTNNPLVINYIGFETPEELQSIFLFCKEGKLIQMNNPKDIYESVMVKIQSLSEVLISEDLWV